MKKIITFTIIVGFVFSSCNTNIEKNTNFSFQTETFGDIKIVRYKVPGFDSLSLKQQKLVYFLSEAGYSGRDIIWDQNYRHNLSIRRALENIVLNYSGDKTSINWRNFMIYTKRVWFSNGIHHHYSMAKFAPDFSKKYFMSLMKEVGDSLNEEAIKAIFDPEFDAKKVNLDPSKGLVLGSAVNFYQEDISEAEVDAYFESIKEIETDQPLSYGLNSKLIRGENGIEEMVYHLDGMYGEAIIKIIYWLEKAVEVSENKAQEDALKLLIEYYKTGDLKTWDDYNIAWVSATEGDIDYINSFIEVYNDPKGYTGSFESLVEITDFEASAQMKVLSDNAQWFEDNSSIMEEHKKKNISGVSYKVVSVASEAGDSSPSTPIGVNLPNSNWIRSTHGSKSVSLGNIVYAYAQAGGEGMLEEFCNDTEEVTRAKKHSKLAGKLHTALHEVLGHASGQLNPGVGTPKETVKSYASTLEEGRADLVALYFMMNKKLIELGLMESLETGKSEYDSYIRNGLMTQMQRLEPGADIEEAHMRNRQWVSAWSYEKGIKENVISKISRNGKTYFEINDYKKLQAIFGDLLMEVQRIKSEGDYSACQALVEDYGVKVDTNLHQEVLARVEKLNIAPYGGFINPKIVANTNVAGEIISVNITYPEDFSEQMLDYAERYSFLPDYN
ncbi:MAG: dihydrofolate reductase [Flavobacteriales bacterium]|nr:dihydrofolate reductase [Flavobacteriales bacterium]